MLRFIIVLASFIILAVIISLALKLIITKITSKTKTQIDDKIVKKIKKPLFYLILLFGVGAALNTLTLGESLGPLVSNVMGSFYILLGMYMLIGIVNLIINEWGKRAGAKSGLKRVLPLFHKISKAILLLSLLMMLLSKWGIDITGLLAGLGVAGIAIGFAVKDSLANIFGGISLIMDKSFSVGDIIELKDGTSGKVVDIGLRSTKIRTWDSELIIVPNGQVANNAIKNKILPEPESRIVIPFGVEYGSSVKKVKTTVLKAVNSVEHVMKNEGKAPNIAMMKMGKSALKFNAYLWVDDYSKKFATKEKATIAIYEALNKAKIVIPYNTITIKR